MVALCAQQVGSIYDIDKDTALAGSTGDVPRPHLVQPVDPQAAQQIGEYSTRRRLVGIAAV
jgi:hypothetical protein